MPDPRFFKTQWRMVLRVEYSDSMNIDEKAREVEVYRPQTRMEADTAMDLIKDIFRLLDATPNAFEILERKRRKERGE